MNIRKIAFRPLTILGITSCNQGSVNQINGQVKTILQPETEYFTFYRKTDKIVEVARAVTISNDSFDLNLYSIDIPTPEGAKQNFISIERLSKKQIDSKKSDLQKNYTWIPFKGDNLFFVQIQPKGFKDEMELLNKRQEIEDKLGKALLNNNLGDWAAGDIGPCGGNMLFTVPDIDKSLTIVIEVLKQNNLDKNVVIGKRVMLDKGDWFYEVIYPIKYSGDFNTM